MTIKLRAKRFRIRPETPPDVQGTADDAPVRAAPRAVATEARAPEARGAEALFDAHDDGFGPDPYPTAARARPAAALANVASAADAGVEAGLDSIRHEGLTGRQLRLARRVAAKHGLPATSDFDAIRLLRQAGIDPFQRSSMIELVSSNGMPAGDSRAVALAPGDGARLPQIMKPIRLPSTEVRAEQNHFTEISRIQADIARRRRRKSGLLMARLGFFVLIPTLLAGWYYYRIATPFYATKSEFVIQQAENPASGGMGGLLSGTQFATSQDSIAVQGYLQSRDALLRLDRDLGFRDHFAQPQIDAVQRLNPDATDEAAYKVFKRNVKIAYDPTEGIIKMEVIAADPAVSEAFARALIGYAEEQVDQLTLRLRGDQMSSARTSFEEAEASMLASQRKVVELQQKYKILSSEVEVSLITTQIGALETQLTQDRLSLAQMLSNETPNLARMEPIERRVTTLLGEIALLRSKLTESAEGGQSLAEVQSELLVAQAEVQTRQLILAQSVQSMETARSDANRQTRYLSVSVNPVPPDEPTYPRAFENTAVALLIFAGIYLMISMTAAILREQVAS